jgi:hypothetical protein
METTRCFNCNGPILSGISFCPHCGQKQSSQFSTEDLGRDPYKILQVSPEAEDEIIAAAYRSLARKYHPDANLGKAQDDRMKDINWAYDILRNPTKRKEWDLKNRRKRDSEKTHQDHSQYSAKADSTFTSAPPKRPAPSVTPTRVNKENGSRGSRRFIILALSIVGLIWYFSYLGSSSQKVQGQQAVQQAAIRTVKPTQSPWECIYAITDYGESLDLFIFVRSGENAQEFCRLLLDYDDGSGFRAERTYTGDIDKRPLKVVCSGREGGVSYTFKAIELEYFDSSLCD